MSAAGTVTRDAFVLVEFVQVVDRYRRDLGDLATLVASIEDVGLLNPITLTRSGRLIAGQRRLAAFQELGRPEIPARFVDSLDDAVRLLHAERDENIERKPMTPEELVNLGRDLEVLERPKALERQGTRFDLTSSSREDEVDDRPTSKTDTTKTDHIVGKALGLSATTYYRAKAVVDAAHDESLAPVVRAAAAAALADMNATGNISGNHVKILAATRANREAMEAKAAALAAPMEPDELDPLPVQPHKTASTARSDDWIPERGDSSPAAAEQRRVLIRRLGSKGHTSDQIAKYLSMLPRTVRTIARDLSIAINADEALGVRTRKSIDSNRIVRESLQTLESLEMGLGLINFDELDRSEMQNWTDSLSNSIRVLNRLNKQLKEMAQ